MKRIRIYRRTVTERTGYRKYPYKAVTQYTVLYGDAVKSNHQQAIDNPKLRVPFGIVLDTRNRKALDAFVGRLGRGADDRWLKRIVADLH